MVNETAVKIRDTALRIMWSRYTQCQHRLTERLITNGYEDPSCNPDLAVMIETVKLTRETLTHIINLTVGDTCINDPAAEWYLTNEKILTIGYGIDGSSQTRLAIYREICGVK